MNDEFLPSSPKQYSHVMGKLDGTLVHQHRGLLPALGQTDSKAASVCLCSCHLSSIEGYISRVLQLLEHSLVIFKDVPVGLESTVLSASQTASMVSVSN